MAVAHGIPAGMKTPSPKPCISPHLVSPRTPNKPANNQRMVEEMRTHIAKLKGGLDTEKSKIKQFHRDKVAEIKQLKDGFERDKDRTLQSVLLKHDQDKQNELQKLRDSLQKEKDMEVRQLLRSQDEQLKQLKIQLAQEKDMAVKSALEIQKRALSEQKECGGNFGRVSPGNSALIVKLQKEIKSLKDSKKEIEDKLQQQQAADGRRCEELKKIKEMHEAELQRIIPQDNPPVLPKEELLPSTGEPADQDLTCTLLPHGEATHNPDGTTSSSSIESKWPTPKMKRANNFMDLRGDCGKFTDTPSGVSSKSSSSRSGSSSRKSSQSSTEKLHSPQTRRSSEDVRDRERERQLQKKVSELTTQVTRLEKRVTVIKAENDSLKKKAEEQKPSEEKIKKLKKRNAELAAIARRLEEKAKQLQQENIKRSRDITSPQSKDAYARPRVREAAEQSKLLSEKEQEIGALQKKCQELSQQLQKNLATNVEDVTADQKLNPEYYEDKEELETIIKQAAKERLRLERQITRQSFSDVPDLNQVRALEETNSALHSEVQRLSQAAQDTEKLEIEVTQRRVECESLYKEIDAAKTQCSQVGNELQDVIEKNTQLTIENSDLQQRLRELEKVNEECRLLKANLAEVESECQVAKEEVTTLQTKVKTLEITIQHLQEEARSRSDLQNEHQQVLERLAIKEQQLEMLSQAKDDSQKDHEEALEGLQAKLRELERKYELQAIKHEELTLEMTQLRQQAQKVQDNSPMSPSNLRLQGDLDKMDRSLALASRSSPRVSPKVSPRHDGSRPRDVGMVAELTAEGEGHPDMLASSTEPEENSFSVEEASNLVVKEITETDIEDTVDMFVAMETPSPLTNGLDDSFEAMVQAEEDRGLTGDLSLDEVLTGHLKQNGHQSDLDLSGISQKIKALSVDSEDEENRLGEEESRIKPKTPTTPSRELYQRGSLTEFPIELTLSKKSPFQVFVAKYSYDPQEFSPNESPESELTINAGDYIFVYGDMDEDGFYEGETMDGRRGLVPSNFIERVPDEDLEDLQNSMTMSQTEETLEASLHEDLEFNSGDEMDQSVHSTTPSAPLHSRGVPEQYSPDVQAEVVVTEISNLHKAVPCPRNLRLDRQLSNSILIGWAPPEDLPAKEVLGYHIYVDGEFKVMVKATDRTKALLEAVDANQTHRVVVRTATNKGQSEDPECTILVGKESTLTPGDLEVHNLTCTSAMLSWVPSDSNFEHIVAVNGIDCCVTKPGIYQVSLSGLIPGKNHRAAVRPKLLKVGHNVQRNMTATLQFTPPSGGIPDPPLDVQVEAGPQEGSLLVTWLPVTINTSGTSNGALVLGYAVFADGKKVKEVKSPTGDHVVVYGPDFNDAQSPTKITMRTISEQQESLDSHVVTVSEQLAQEIKKGLDNPQKKESDSTVLGTETEDDVVDDDEELKDVPEDSSSVSHSTPPEGSIHVENGELSQDSEITSDSNGAGENSTEIKAPTAEPQITEGDNTGFDDDGICLDPMYLSDSQYLHQFEGRKVNEKDVIQGLKKANLCQTVDSDGIDENCNRASKASGPMKLGHGHGDQNSQHAQGSYSTASTMKSFDNLFENEEETQTAEYSDDEGSLTGTGDYSDGETASMASSEELETHILIGSLDKKPRPLLSLDAIQDSSTELSDIAEVDEDRGEYDAKGHEKDKTPLASPVHVPNQFASGASGKRSPRSQNEAFNRSGAKSPHSPRHEPKAVSPSNGAMSPSGVALSADGVPLHSRTPPRGAESPPKSSPSSTKKSSLQKPANKVSVPHIEITKDSSGSLSASGPENYTDDDMESAISSTSGMTSSKQSPMTPDRQFYDLHKMNNGHKRGLQNSKQPLDSYQEEYDAHGNLIRKPADKQRSGRMSGSAGKSDKRRDYIDENMEGYAARTNPDHRKVSGRPAPSGGRHTPYDESYEIMDNNEISSRKIRDDIPDSDLIDYEDDGEGESLLDDAEMEFDESQVRIFIALFNYDPRTMSPNPDAAEEELPFKEGQLIKIYGDKDPDGFYFGAADGQRGLVPGNMISEVQVDDPDIAAQLLNDSIRLRTPLSQRSTPGQLASRSAGPHQMSPPDVRQGSGRHTPGRHTPGRHTPTKNSRENNGHGPLSPVRPHSPGDRHRDRPDDRSRRDLTEPHDRHTPERQDGRRTPSGASQDPRDLRRTPEDHRRRGDDPRRPDDHRRSDDHHRGEEQHRMDDHRRPSDDQRRTSDDRRRRTDDHRSQDHRRLDGPRGQDDHRRPSDDHRRSADDHRHRGEDLRRKDDHRRSSDSHRRSQESNHRPADDHRRSPSDHRRPSDDRRRSDDHRRQNGISPRSARASSRQGGGGRRRSGSRSPNGSPYFPAEGPMKRMVALYDYDPVELSPNVDAELELTFKTGEIIFIYGMMDEDGFYMGECKGQRGLVPSNFLQEAPEEKSPKPAPREKVSIGSESHSAVEKSEQHSLVGKSSTTDLVTTATGSRIDMDMMALNTSNSIRSKSPKKDSEEIERIPSPVRTITFDDNLSVKEKKKKGFFSKNIFKKFSR